MWTPMRTVGLLIVFLLATLTQVACNTAEGVGEDIEAVGEELEETSEETQDDL